MFVNIMYNMLKSNPSNNNNLSEGNLNNNNNSNINNLYNNNNPLYEPIESAKVYDETNGGIFCDKFLLHVIPVEMNNKNNLFMNRISYNTKTNAYYENGILSDKYLKKWEDEENNIEFKNDDGEISWKFDYRIGSYIINSLNLKLSYHTKSIQWFIKPLPTMKNPNPTWNLIKSNTNIEIKDVSKFVKNEYGFILMARLIGDDEQDLNKLLFIKNIDETFGLDVKVELKPDIIVDSLPRLHFSDGEAINDFIIHYEFSTDEDQNIYNNSNGKIKKIKDFNVYSKILSERSDYFNTLLKSKNKTLTLTDSDISYESLKNILNFLYTGILPNIETYDDWITLLRYSSKFLIPTLIQRCEKALKDYLNHDNLIEIENIANECNAKQLLQCCKNLNCQ
jgi:hypothetical protein